MAYNPETVARVRTQLEERRRLAVEEAERRKFLLYTEIPQLAEMDREISSVGVRVFRRALEGGEIEADVMRMKEEHNALRTKRGALLQAHGYPADYTDIHYHCAECGDTGFVNTKMCSCMRRELALASYEDSGIGHLMQTQSFSSFSMDYYTGQDRENMAVNARTLCDFARDFARRREENYLLIGATGLGKTHLSTAVAREVIDRGFHVVYDTAQGMFSAFEAARFGRGSNTDEERYLQCDLLILDDLGTEMTNNFTLSCLYNVINTRLSNRRATIASTNLNGQELRQRYADRITSRLFGEFRILQFAGKDIRAQKLARK